MPSISKTAHYKFTATTQAILSLKNLNPEQLLVLQDEISALELLFEKYKSNIKQLYKMVSDYDKMQRSIRHNIKKTNSEATKNILR